jgi:cation:H+ antiporter
MKTQLKAAGCIDAANSFLVESAVMLVLWLQFILCAAAIVSSGIRLSYFSDVIAEKSGLGRTWIGVTLLAFVTSLPELVTGVSSVTFAGVPDITVGDLLGSCLFNLTIIALMDLFHPHPGVVLARAEQLHILSAGYGIVMLVTAAMGLFMGHAGIDLSLLWFGGYSPILFLMYFFGMWSIYRFRHKLIPAKEKSPPCYGKVLSRSVYRGFFFHAAVILAAATYLPFVGEDLAAATGWGQTFFGMLFVAIATSLPEIVTSLAALRMGAVDLAVGNLLGSNMLNLAILALDDFLFIQGPILAHVSETHLLPALTGILLTGIVILTLYYQPGGKRHFRMTWLAPLLLVLYVLNAVAVYLLEWHRP